MQHALPASARNNEDHAVERIFSPWMHRMRGDNKNDKTMVDGPEQKHTERNESCLVCLSS